MGGVGHKQLAHVAPGLVVVEMVIPAAHGGVGCPSHCIALRSGTPQLAQSEQKKWRKECSRPSATSCS